MSEPEENGTVESRETIEGPSAATESEYHFKPDDGDRIYADAHYVPENENTEPPKYYKPPERTVKVTASPKKKKKEDQP